MDDGFSFVEVAVVIALMGMLAVISLPSLKTYASRRDMIQGTQQLAGDLRLAQQFAMAQSQNAQLAYAPSSTSSYTICCKVSDGSIVKDVLLPSSLTVRSTFTSPANTAVFGKTGAPTQGGTFCIEAGVSTVMKVDVQAISGRITIQEATTCGF